MEGEEHSVGRYFKAASALQGGVTARIAEMLWIESSLFKPYHLRHGMGFTGEDWIFVGLLSAVLSDRSSIWPPIV